MHKIKLYGLNKSSNDSITITSGYGVKTAVAGVASSVVNLDCLWLRPHRVNEGEIYTAPSKQLVNASQFRKQFEIESYPLENNAYDLKEQEISNIFNYYQVYIGIESFIFNPFQTMTSTLVLPVVLTEYGYNEINGIYKSITMTLQAQYV